ncbi:glycosyltransferase [Fictibacillus enclensis]|uniref:glycosyltransferase n=1 Tax=Fictibacillus enclensis TaxID=1017270 RepID=UPI0025A25D9A|nr:glycosyltransferase [Fictibacillus enclensis]MDM5198676.1 glycosyltransferase [Fictibacillus enclensis]
MVSVITCTIRDSCMEEVFLNFDRQQDVEKELIIILNKDNMDAEKWRKRALNSSNISIYHLPSNTTLGECLNFGVEKAKFSYIAKFDDDDYYSPYYLMHSLQSLRNSQASVVGKTSIFMYFKDQGLLTEFNPNKFGGTVAKNEETYDNHLLMGGTLVFKKEVFNTVKFSSTNIAEDAAFCKSCIENGIPVYSATKDNYVYLRSYEPDSHTWRIKNDTILKFCTVIAKTDDYRPYITKKPIP